MNIHARSAGGTLWDGTARKYGQVARRHAVFAGVWELLRQCCGI